MNQGETVADMRRTFISRVLLILGGGLIVAGQKMLAQFDAAVAFLAGHFNPGPALLCALNDILPCGVALGYVAVGLGGLLVATAIGLPPAPPEPESAPATHAGGRRWEVALLAIAIGLAALGSVLSIRTQTGTWPLLLWLATFLLPLLAMLTIDRRRGTSFGNPFPQRWEWLAMFLLVALDLVLVGHDMTHWRWAGTPDETDFFGVAKSIATGASGRPLLSEAGVFMFQPVLSSLYPAIFMFVFGVNVFAWKLSSAVALAGSLPFVYLVTRELWNRRTAMMAAAFLGSAQLAVGFAHFGYNNVQVYLVIAGALGTLAWAHRRQSLCGHYLAGCIAGLGFYTYYTARVVAPLLFLLIWTGDGFPLARHARRQTAALTLGLGLTILPIFSDLGTLLHNMLQLAITPEQASTPAATVARVFKHWLLSIVHGLWYPGPHHFQSNPIDDPISGTLAVVGFCLCVLGWRRANGAFLAGAYLLSTFLVGATSQHFRPPLTRLLFLSPLTAMLAAVAADQLLRALLGTTETRQRIASVAACGLVGAVVAWNIASLGDDVRNLHHGYGRGTTSELIKMTEHLPARCRIIFIQLTEDQDGLVPLVMDEYGMNERLIYRRDLDPPTIATLRTAPPPFVVFADIADPQSMTKLEATMAERFPAGVWQASDPGQPWNLRYFDVSGTDLSPSS